MSTGQELFSLYGRWRGLTDNEAEGIRAGAWEQVDECQAAKLELQGQILAATDRFQAVSKATGEPLSEVETQIRKVVGELILLEMRNGELIEDQKQKARHQKDELDRSSRNLKQIRLAYAPSREALWQSYS
jgi:hypothetical protein